MSRVHPCLLIAAMILGACGGQAPTEDPQEIEEVIGAEGKADVASPIGFIKGTWVATSKAQTLRFLVINEDGTYVRGDAAQASCQADCVPRSTRGAYTLTRKRFLFFVTGEYLQLEAAGDWPATPKYKMVFSPDDYWNGATSLQLLEGNEPVLTFGRGPKTFCRVAEDCAGQIDPPESTYSLGCSPQSTCSICPALTHMPGCAGTLEPLIEAETGCITGYRCN